MSEENQVEVPEEGLRRIMITIFDEEGDSVFEVSGNVSRKTTHRFMESVGHVFVPEEPPQRPSLAFMPIAVGKISCEHVIARDCVDYSTKCSECAKNMAKSYFKPKEE